MRFGPIFDLRFFILLGDYQSRGDVCDAHGGIGRVHGLSARSRGTEGVDAQILGFDLDVDIVGFRRTADWSAAEV